MRRALVLVLLLVAGALVACSEAPAVPAPQGTTAGPSLVPFPATLTAYVDQSRLDRVGRQVFVRLVNDADPVVTVTRAEVVSDRFDTIVWTGDTEVVNENDLELELPPGRCGTGSDAEVTLTYSVGDGPEQVSRTRATDRYGAIGLLLDRDCAQQTMAEAADVTLGEDRVVGVGRGSTFRLPVTFTATGSRDDVAFGGFERTVLFSAARPTPVWQVADVVPLVAGTTRTVELRLVPGRCDPHALAEDKVGTLVEVHVVAPGLPEGASYYLPISDRTRADLRGFFTTHCGL